MSNQKIKEHFDKYKTAYLISGGVILGVVIAKVFLPGITISVPVTNNIPIVNNNVSSAIANGGYMHKLVKCIDTGQIWETVKDAAEAAGVSSSMMSKHINGHRDHINEMQYVIIGLGT